jgi:hypothetical protein
MANVPTAENQMLLQETELREMPQSQGIMQAQGKPHLQRA